MKQGGHPKRKYRALNIVMTAIVALSSALSVSAVALVLAETSHMLLLTVVSVGAVVSTAATVGFTIFVSQPVRRIATMLERIDAASVGAELPEDSDKPALQSSELSYIESKIRDLQGSIKVRLAPSAKDERRRKILMASICHDLRTPLTSITGYVEAIQDGIGNSDEHLRTILDKAQYMNRLIDDLDVHAKNDLDKLTIFKKPVLAHEILSRCISGIKDPRIVLTEPVVKAYIHADAYRVVQVLDNVISNARKFAKDRIDISTDVDDTYYIIRVADDGEGVPQNYSAAIFDPFFTSRKNSDSAGLGLSIAKNLMEAHGGSIELADETSRRNRSGAEFIIKFKLVTGGAK